MSKRKKNSNHFLFIYLFIKPFFYQHLSSCINSNKIIKLELTIPLTDIMKQNAHLNATRLEHKTKIEELEKTNAKLLEKIQGTYSYM